MIDAHIHMFKNDQSTHFWLGPQSPSCTGAHRSPPRSDSVPCGVEVRCFGPPRGDERPAARGRTTRVGRTRPKGRAAGRHRRDEGTGRDEGRDGCRYCDKYCFPNDSQIELIDSVWTEEQLSTLTSYGISLENIKAEGFDAGKDTKLSVWIHLCEKSKREL